ncbi:MAG: hypothetical protein K2K54_07750, partial [Lachnospiraceae bacterium]|nr:hypothetical protein [Lachnospiraceae bacterium]
MKRWGLPVLPCLMTGQYDPQKTEQEDSRMDHMITIAVVAAFAFILYRKHKKKKSQTAPDAGTVQTSGLSPTLHGTGTATGTGPGTVAPFPY